MKKGRQQRASEVAEKFVADLKRENLQGRRNEGHVEDKKYDRLQRLLQREIVSMSHYQSAR